MIEETAEVIEVDGEHVWVEVRRQSACGKCSANKVCGTAVLQKVFGNKRTRIRVLTSIPVAIGDKVIVGLDEAAFLKGSFAIYLIPLIFMFVFGLLGETMAAQLLMAEEIQNNTLVVLFALLGLIVGAFWLRHFNSRVYKDPRYQPVILRQVLNNLAV